MKEVDMIIIKDIFKKVYIPFFYKLNSDKEFQKRFDRCTVGCKIQMFEDIMDEKLENTEVEFNSTVKEDTVNHPTHYTDGKIEVIDFIEDKQLNFHRGNAVKYIARAGKKDKSKEIEDLQKAVWYLNREISRLTVENK